VVIEIKHSGLLYRDREYMEAETGVEDQASYGVVDQLSLVFGAGGRMVLAGFPVSITQELKTRII
jgi:hypothetical protein